MRKQQLSKTKILPFYTKIVCVLPDVCTKKSYGICLMLSKLLSTVLQTFSPIINVLYLLSSICSKSFADVKTRRASLCLAVASLSDYDHRIFREGYKSALRKQDTALEKRIALPGQRKKVKAATEILCSSAAKAVSSNISAL